MIAELPVDVAADLVPKLRAVAAEGLRAAARAPLAVEFLTPDKLLRKVYRRLAKGENKDRFNAEVDPPRPDGPKVRLEWAPWLEGPVEKLLAAVKGEREA
eukprot:EG_transcript_32910